MNRDLDHGGNRAPFRLINGRLLDVTEPDPALFSIEDIAHALALINRYGGHAKWPYSVATHSVLVSFLAGPSGLAYEGLMHDFTEALGLVDVPSATKRLFPEYRALEARVRARIAPKFGLAREEPHGVKDADTIAYWCENAALRDQPLPPEFGLHWHVAEPFLSHEIAWRDAREMFLLRYADLAPRAS